MNKSQLKKTKIIFLAILVLSLLLLPHALAETTFEPSTIPKPDYLPGPTGDAIDSANKNLITTTVLPRLALGLIGFVGAISVLFLIIGGFLYAISYGEEENVERAKRQVMYSIIGLLIAIFSYTIVSLVINFRYQGDKAIRPTPQATEEKTTTEPENNDDSNLFKNLQEQDQTSP